MANWYISPTGNDTTGIGSLENPYLTIKKGISSCTSNGDVVICLDGTYTETSLADIYYNITIKSYSEDYTKVIITTSGTTNLWRIKAGGVTVLDVTIVVGLVDTLIRSDGSMSIIFARGLIYSTNSNYPNYAAFYQGYSAKSANIKIYKSTIQGCKHAISGYNITLEHKDCIFKGNNTVYEKYGGTDSITSQYNCYYGNTTLGFSAGVGDIISNPKLVSATSAEIESDSPCIDAGVVVAGYIEDYEGDAPDIGCYECVSSIETFSTTINSIILFFQTIQKTIDSVINFKGIKIPEGLCIFWDDESTNPGIGWTEETAYDGRFIKFDATPLQTGGTTEHNHSVAGNVDMSIGDDWNCGDNYEECSTFIDHQHYVSGALDSSEVVPRHSKYRLFYKNSLTDEYIFPLGAILMIDVADVPIGWESLNLDGYYIRLGTSTLGSGISSIHSHNYSFYTDPYTSLGIDSDQGNGNTAKIHKHPVIGISSESTHDTWEVDNVAFNFIKKIGSDITPSGYAHCLYRNTGTAPKGWEDVTAYADRYLKIGNTIPTTGDQLDTGTLAQVTGITAHGGYYPDELYPASNSIDENESTYYSDKFYNGADSVRFLYLSLTAPRIVQRYKLTCKDSSTMYDFYFEGSNDGTNWTVLDTQTGLTWTTGETKTFDIANNDSYSYYMIKTQSTHWYGVRFAIAELRIYAKGEFDSHTISGDTGEEIETWGQGGYHNQGMMHHTHHYSLTSDTVDLWNYEPEYVTYRLMKCSLSAYSMFVGQFNIESDIRYVLDATRIEHLTSNIKFFNTDTQAIDSLSFFVNNQYIENIVSDIIFRVVGKKAHIPSDIKFILSKGLQNIYSGISFLNYISRTIISNVWFSMHRFAYLDSNVWFSGLIHTDLNSDIRFVKEYEGKFIHNGQLYIVTDTTPAKIIKVNIDDAIPTYNNQVLTQNKAKDLAINFSTEKGYIALDAGKVVKFDLSDLSSQTEFDLSDSSQMLNVINREDYRTTYIGTDEYHGELFVIDEASYGKINSSFDFLKEYYKTFKSYLSIIFGYKINVDFQFLKEGFSQIQSDLRFLTSPYTTPVLIKREDFSITLDGVALAAGDLILSSIEVSQLADERNTAVFELTRNHDNMDYTLAGVYSQITAKNSVIIYLQGLEIFSGKIEQLNCLGSGEKIKVSCKDTEDSQTQAMVKNLPLTSLNSQISPYDILLDDIEIYNPTPDASDEDYKGVMIDLGEYYVEGINVTQNPPANNGGAVEWEPSPDFGLSFEDIAEQVNAGTFKFEPGKEYFWFVSTTKYGFVLPEETPFAYVGTSLSSTTGDLFKITKATYGSQRSYLADSNGELGYYYIGQAPYKEVSCKNGFYKSIARWEDKTDGLYRVRNDSYNYVNYAKAVAAVEYRKLCGERITNNLTDMNINTLATGLVYPKTSASIKLTLDGYMFYELQLLNSINIVNTTQPNIYVNQNGFPLRIKGINISANAMQVVLTLDNTMTSTEIDKLTSITLEDGTVVPLNDDGYPEEPVVHTYNSIRYYRKLDLSTGEYVEDSED